MTCISCITQSAFSFLVGALTMIDRSGAVMFHALGTAMLSVTSLIFAWRSGMRPAET